MDSILWLAIIPAFVTIILSIWTKKIIPALIVGLSIGGILKSESLIQGVPTTVNYIIDSLSNKGNLEVLVFLYLFSGLVGLIKKSGGIKAFTSSVDKKIENKRSVFYYIFILVPITFIDCGFRVMSTGSIIKPLSKKYNIAKERLAFMLNNTASPIIVLIPIATTFIGYNISIINQGLNVAGKENISGYKILLQSIPFQFFSIVVIMVTIMAVFFDIKNTKFYKEKKAEDEEEGNMDMDNKERIKPRLINMLLPMVLVILLSFMTLLIYGINASNGESGLGTIMESINPTLSMLIGLFLAIILTGILFIIQGYSIKDVTDDLIAGGNDMMNTIVILVLAWPLSNISMDLGLSQLIRNTLGGYLSPEFVPVTIYIITCLVSYLIGTSWGSWALAMPVAIPLAVTTGVGIPITVAAVLSGGTFGDITSPISGMTNMSSNISNAKHMKYIRYASYYNIFAGIIAGVLFIIFPLI